MGLIHHPHDKFFKLSFKERAVVIDFLKAHFPKELYPLLDLNSLSLTDKSYVTRRFEELHSDLVYTCRLQDRTTYLPVILLFEHLSSAHQHIALRLMEYTLCLIHDHLSAGHTSYPLVFPICVYHGSISPYPYSTDIYDHFDHPDLARQWVFKPCQLIDLNQLSEESIRTHGTAAVVETLLKYSEIQDLVRAIRRLAQEGVLRLRLKQISDQQLEAMIEYTLSSKKDQNILSSAEVLQVFIEAFPNQVEVVMTFLDELRQESLAQGQLMGLEAGRLEGKLEGILEGILEGKLEGRLEEKLGIARNMLRHGVDLTLVQQITGLSNMDLIQLSSDDL